MVIPCLLSLSSGRVRKADHVWSVVKEWQWRHNHKGEDLFTVLLKDIEDGYYR